VFYIEFRSRSAIWTCRFFEGHVISCFPHVFEVWSSSEYS
jgi:hypothetical protein